MLKKFNINESYIIMETDESKNEDDDDL